MSASAPRIPDMFLRALKRKQPVTVASVTRGTEIVRPAKATTVGEKKRDAEEEEGTVEKRGRGEEVESENRPTLSAPSEVTVASPSSGGTVVEEPDNGSEDPSSGPQPLHALIECNEWRAALGEELRRPYVAQIEAFLERERSAGKTVFPPRREIFTALNLTPLSRVKVVLIGQDPYHNDGQAHGLCFSVKRGIPAPPSLKNVYKELAADLPGFRAPDHGFLENWARQGILMLNAALTVRAHEANSHSKIGWYTLTDRLISIVSREREGVVFLLWGGFAHKKATLVDTKKHAIVSTAHPSPLSARHFLGCRCFSKVNERLAAFGKEPIRWGDL